MSVRLTQGTGRYFKAEFTGSCWRVWIKSPDFINGVFILLYPDGTQEVWHVNDGKETKLQPIRHGGNIAL